jgi:hypothetical protein
VTKSYIEQLHKEVNLKDIPFLILLNEDSRMQLPSTVELQDTIKIIMGERKYKI